MNFIIRSAVMKDYDGLCRLFEEGDTFHRERTEGLFRIPADGAARSPEYIQTLIEDPASAIFVADRQGMLLGMVVVLLRQTQPFPIVVQRTFGMIDSLVVSEAYRDQGIGRRLMERAEEWARLNGAESIELNVYHFNQPAIHLYEKMGYAATTQRMRKVFR